MDSQSQPQPSVKVQNGDKPIVKDFPKRSSKSTLKMALITLLVVAGGILVGWFFSGSKKMTSSTAPLENSNTVESSSTEAGLKDENPDWDTAEGTLVEGGIEGEGTHHLDRGMGPQKDVYLTSTVIDLEKFVGKKVTIWGDTISSKHAPWLIDVAKIKVSE